MPKGSDLRLKRQAAFVSQTDLARAIGLARQTVWTIEGRAFVSDALAEKYLAGLASLERAKGGPR